MRTFGVWSLEVECPLTPSNPLGLASDELELTETRVSVHLKV